MAIRTSARRAIPVTPQSATKITERAHALALKLYEAGAGDAEVPVTKDMLWPAFSELVTKRVVKRSGLNKGR